MLTLERTQTEIALGPVSQIPPGEGRVFSVSGLEIAVFHTRGGQVYAVQVNAPIGRDRSLTACSAARR